MAVLFISENKLKKSTTINGNVDVELLRPYMKVAQDIHIHPKLGTDLYNKLQSDISGSSLTGNYQTLVENYIQDALVHWTLYECIPFLGYKIMNKNIVRKTSEQSENAGLDELNYLREVVRNTAEWYTERLIDWLRHNNNLVPEYNTATNEDLKASKRNFYSGMNLDPTRKRPGGIRLDDFLTPDLSID
tara:strand:+ start:192 stop:758 length:567 start_codon:yes stop_codon:yes gene_type:complete